MITLRSNTVWSFVVVAGSLALTGCGPADIPEVGEQAVLDETSEFVPAYPGDDSGALLSDDVSQALTVNVPGGTKLKCTTPVNFRVKPDPDAKLIDTLAEGTVVTKTDHKASTNDTNGYYEVTYDGKTGWVWGPSLLDYKGTVIRWGLHPNASDALVKAGVKASRISQTIGNARASAGYHKADGTVNGRPYTTAVDISVYGMSTSQIHSLLDRLASVGYAAWYRRPGYDGWPRNQAAHIHANYVNAKAKAVLDSQVRSWLNGRNGLTGNRVYNFHKWSSGSKAYIRHVFEETND